MDGRWADGPDETSTTVNDVIQPWLPMSSWNQPAPPCSRCGAAFAAHLEGRCPPAEYRAPRRDWPTRHPWYTAAILLVALLGGIGVGTISVSHTNYNTGNYSASSDNAANANACNAYWQLRDAIYASDYQGANTGWYKLTIYAPEVTDPALSNAVQAFNLGLGYRDLPYLDTSFAIEAACNNLGYTDPSQ